MKTLNKEKKLQKLISFLLIFVMIFQSVYTIQATEETPPTPENTIKYIDRDEDHYYDSDSPATEVGFEKESITFSTTLITPQTVDPSRVSYSWKPILSDYYMPQWYELGTNYYYTVGDMTYTYECPTTNATYTYTDYDYYHVWTAEDVITYEDVRVWDCVLEITDLDLAWDDYSFQAGWYTVIDKQKTNSKGYLMYKDSEDNVYYYNKYRDKLYLEDGTTESNKNINSLTKVMEQATNENGYLEYTNGTSSYFYDEENAILYNSSGTKVNIDVSTLKKVIAKIEDYEVATRHILGVEPTIDTNYTIVQDLKDTSTKLGQETKLEASFVANKIPNYVRWEYSKNNGETWYTVDFGTIETTLCEDFQYKINEDGYYVCSNGGKTYYYDNNENVVYEENYIVSDINIDQLIKKETQVYDTYGFAKYENDRGEIYYYNQYRDILYNQYYQKVNKWILYRLSPVTSSVITHGYTEYTKDNKTYYIKDDVVYEFGYAEVNLNIEDLNKTPLITPSDIRNLLFEKYEDACGFKTTLTIDETLSQYNGYLFRVYVGETEDETDQNSDPIHDIWTRTKEAKLTVEWNVVLDMQEGSYTGNEYHWPSATIEINTEQLIKSFSIEVLSATGNKKINYDRTNTRNLTITTNNNYMIFTSATGLSLNEWKNLIRDNVWLELEDNSSANVRFILSLHEIDPSLMIGVDFIPENVDYSVVYAEANSDHLSKIRLTPNKPTTTNGTSYKYLDFDVSIPLDLTLKSVQIGFSSSVSTEKISCASSTGFKIVKRSDTNWVVTATTEKTQEEWEEYLRNNVTFTLIQGREISISWRGSSSELDGTEYFNEANGHYYKIISKANISWEQAYSTAKQSSLYGMHGYLMNIADKAEDDFIKTLLPNASAGYWIGEGCDYQYINAVITAKGRTGKFSSGKLTSRTVQQILDIGAYVNGDPTYTYNGTTYTTTNYDGQDLGGSYGLWFILTGPEAGQLLYYQTSKTKIGTTVPGQVFRTYLEAAQRDQVYHRFVHYTSGNWPFCYTGHAEVPYYIVEFGGDPSDLSPDLLRDFGIGQDTVNPGVRDLVITKNWVDENNKYETRPGTLDIDIYQNDVYFQTITLNIDNSLTSNANSWQKTLLNIPKYDDNGAEYIYTIQEDESNKNLFYYYQEPEYNQDSLTVTNTAVWLPIGGHDLLLYDIFVSKEVMNSSGLSLSTSDLDQIELITDKSYLFPIELKQLNKTLSKGETGMIESYEGYSGKVFNGLVTIDNELIFRNIEAGKYEISEKDVMYFSFIGIEEIFATEGASLTYDNGKYYITLSGITNTDERIYVNVINEIHETRAYNQKQEKENYFQFS